MNKLDLIAIPDLGCVAMENWGLITVRLVSMYAYIIKTSTQNKPLNVCYCMSGMYMYTVVSRASAPGRSSITHCFLLYWALTRCTGCLPCVKIETQLVGVVEAQ